MQKRGKKQYTILEFEYRAPFFSKWRKIWIWDVFSVLAP